MGRLVAENIRLRRDLLRWTYVELASKVTDAGRAINPQSIKRIEEGDRRVDVDDLAAIAGALGCPPIDLLEDPSLRAGVTAEAVQNRLADVMQYLNRLASQFETDSRGVLDITIPIPAGTLLPGQVDTNGDR